MVRNIPFSYDKYARSNVKWEKIVKSDQDGKSMKIKGDVPERSDRKDKCYSCSKGFGIF